MSVGLMHSSNGGLGQPAASCGESSRSAIKPGGASVVDMKCLIDGRGLGSVRLRCSKVVESRRNQPNSTS